MALQHSIVINEKESRFETEVDGEFAYVDYRFYGNDMAFMHTFVPEIARGKGIAMDLAKFVLDYAKENKLMIKVYCPSISKFIERHPEYEVLIDKRHNG